MNNNIEFTKEEVKALYDLIDMLSNNNPENIFSPDDDDPLDDPMISAAVKIFSSCGRNVPARLLNLIPRQEN